MSAQRSPHAAELHALILTRDEERHIERCIRSILPVATSVTLMDSGSTDRTVTIARSLGAQVLTHPWINHATQMNALIAAVEGRGGWLMRIDADEILEAAERESLLDFLATQPDGVTGVAVRRRIHFMGRRIRHGGIEPSWQLRVFRAGRGWCEHRWMDEHIIVDGAVARSPFQISDISLKPLTWWTEKHNGYASREAIDQLNARMRPPPPDRRIRPSPASVVVPAKRTSPGARLKRIVKTEIYGRLPLGLRSTLYFLGRYVFLLGFLDGRPGFFFHALQAFWYRTLVDAKVAEIVEHARAEGITLTEAIRETTGVDVTPRQERERV